MHLLEINKKRESGVELLKIFAIFGIVLVHTYTDFTLAVDYSDGLIYFDKLEFSVVSYYLFQLIIPFGYLGNMIFYVSTSWFLVDAKKIRIEKIVIMSIKAFLISATCLLINYFLGHEVKPSEITELFFPITRMSYWFVSCYILLYSISPLLNKLIDNIDKKTHFNVCLISFLLYFIFIYFTAISELFINKFFVFVIVYLIVAYLKKYKYDFCENTKKQLLLFIVSTSIFYFMITYNFAIAPIGVKWHEMYNPFFLCMAFSLLNIFIKFNFKSMVVNTISGLTLYIYMFQGNALEICSDTLHLTSKIMSGGPDFIFARLLVSVFILFIILLFISSIFHLVFNNLINKISLFITDILKKIDEFIFAIIG